MSACKHLKVSQEDGARVFSAVLSNKTRSNGHKLKREFHLAMRKKFCTLRVAQHWNYLRYLQRSLATLILLGLFLVINTDMSIIPRT